jgi:aminoglycoside 3-N-acetyltransferase
MAEDVVTRTDIATGVRRLGLEGQVICLHASLRSFPRLEEGPATLVEGLLDMGATVLVATMANEAFAIPAPLHDRPARNGIVYPEAARAGAQPDRSGFGDVYDHSRSEVDTWLGATSAYVARRPDRVRCRRSPEFSAVGPMAEELIEGEVEADIFGPLRSVIAHQGSVLLVGVSLIRMTLLHLAETMAGRKPFIRWMRGPDGRPIRVRGGECSLGFDRLNPVLAPIERQTMVGDSLWRAFPAARVGALAAAAIKTEPEVTHCDNPDCLECADAIAGGPLEP